MDPAEGGESPYYQTGRAVSEYLLFHYGKHDDILPYPFGPAGALDFPVRCVTECLRPELLAPGARGLDIGCAVGRSAFELARVCEEVLGVDASARFIEAARQVASEGRVVFQRLAEGGRFVGCEGELPEGIDRSRVRFEEGDAMELPENWAGYDVILCANLIDRLPDPAAFLRALPGGLNRGGQLIITSPYTWSEEHTPKEAWLGQREGDSFQHLCRLLEPECELLARRDLPFLIREHNRKYQWSVADATTWRRR